MSCLFYLPIMSFYFCVLARPACLRPPLLGFLTAISLQSVEPSFQLLPSFNPLLWPDSPPPLPHTLLLLLLPPLDLCHQEVATSVSFERGGSTSQEHFTPIAHDHSIDGDI